jgi:EAL domain-containing protein (putative c-di-GMP-specific phosphodiesterase class I)
MQEPALGTPWLERDSDGGPVEKTPVLSFPFRIGRNDTADLHIDSNQVSREHAVITRHGKKFHVQDLGSTNGTFINGERIEEAILADGDVLSFAEVEFLFFCGTQSFSRQTATQVMHAGAPGTPPRDATWTTLLGLRRAHEVAVQRAVRTLFQPVVELATGKAFAYEALASCGADATADPRCGQLTAQHECRANDRVRRLFRRLAVEQSASLPAAGRLLLAVAAAELNQARLLEELIELQAELAPARRLVIEIPDSAVRLSPEFMRQHKAFREVGIEIAFDDYASSKAQILERQEIAADFLKLAPSMVRSIHRGEDRQRQVQLIISTSEQLGCRVIATGIDSEEDLRLCQELGCGLAQGELWGLPQPAGRHGAAPPAATKPHSPR